MLGYYIIASVYYSVVCNSLTIMKDVHYLVTYFILCQALPKLTEGQGNTANENERCVALLSELVLALERMADQGLICGPDRERLFEIVEKSPHHQRSVGAISWI